MDNDLFQALAILHRDADDVDPQQLATNFANARQILRDYPAGLAVSELLLHMARQNTASAWHPLFLAALLGQGGWVTDADLEHQQHVGTIH